MLILHEQRDTQKQARQAVGHHLRKEVMRMPITITIHVFGYTLTFRIAGKSNNRHSGK